MSLTQTVNINNPQQSGLPQSLIYDRTLPRGFASSFKRWEVNPQTSFNTYNPTDTIRFIIETQDYIDPYNSYLEIEVEFNPFDYVKSLKAGSENAGTNPNPTYTNGIQSPPIFMLDGPSTSLISQLILYSNSREVERVQEYDQIGNLIADLNLDIGEKWFKAHEGYQPQRPMANDNSPYISTQYQQGLLNTGGTTSTNAYVSNASWAGTFTNSTGILLKGGRYYLPGDRTIPVVGYTTSQNNTVDALGMLGFITGGIIHNMKILGPFQHAMTLIKYNNAKTYATTTNKLVRYHTKNSYTTEFICMDGSGGVQGTNTSISGSWGSVSDLYNGYQLYGGASGNNANRANFEEAQSDQVDTAITGTTAYGVRNDTNLTDPEGMVGYPAGGFMRPYSAGSSFNYGVYFAPTMVRHTIYNGSFINYGSIGQYAANRLGFEPMRLTDNVNVNRFRETRKTFLIPILSGVLGTLIPKESWKLIPGQGCGQLLFEWRFNPNAFFVSGPNYDANELYNNDAWKGPFDPIRDQYQIKYRFTKCSMKFDLWNFGPNVDQYLLSQHPQGIYMTSRMFTQGPSYQVPSSSAATNSWQINNGISSLRQIYFYFLSNDYMKYNWCRKNFKCSRNLTSVQLKIGQNYIPQTGPIIGHSGQLFKNQIMQLDYIPFYTELQRSLSSVFLSGKLSSDPYSPNITPEQFVVDQRPYEPQKFVDVGFGNALFHETRCRGQAIYTVDLLSDPFDESVLTGIDTKSYRPIELITKSAGDIVSSPTPTTMFIFLYHDLLVRFSAEGIYTAGYG